MKKRILLLLASALLLASGAHADARAFVKAQGRGINLGNILEAPSEGSWGVRLDPADFSLIASKGFQNVRIPIRWDGRGAASGNYPRALRTPPYTIDPRFFARVDSAISWARQNRLVVLINDHHHDSLFQNLEHERPRFLAIWKQIAERYKDLPDSVAFEILNEPNTQVTIEAWNELLDTTLQVIRESNPTRPVVIGTANWGGLSGLSGLKFPENDSNLILTIHYYEPFSFTHQGAEWVTPPPPTGVEWKGTYYEKLAVRQAMDAIADYAKARNVPVFIGEFGAYSQADLASRARWAAYSTRLFEAYGFSWAWWEFKAGFGIYDEGLEEWNMDLLNALISSDTSNLAVGTPPTGGFDLALNGSFATTGDWSLNASQGASDFTVDSGAALVTITEPSTDAWGIQLVQAPVFIRKGVTYVLQFDAWASSPRGIDGGVGMNKLPWSVYATAAAGLKTTPKTFFTSFVPAETDSAARICFNLGPDTGAIHIDNVKLLAWEPDPNSIAKRTIVREASVRWQGGALLSARQERPDYNWIADLSGRRVARLDWTQDARGWRAAADGVTTGTWLLLGAAGSQRVVVVR